MINKLLSTKHNATSINLGMLLLRVGLSVIMMHHGYNKLVNFGTLQGDFMNFMGIGKTLSLALVVFAEFFCSLFLMIGLFSRLVTVPLIVTMAVAFFKAHDAQLFDKFGQVPALFLMGYVVVLLCGPGKFSVDGLMGK
jgi:putative oxidoreductase